LIDKDSANCLGEFTVSGVWTLGLAERCIKVLSISRVAVFGRTSNHQQVKNRHSVSCSNYSHFFV